MREKIDALIAEKDVNESERNSILARKDAIAKELNQIKDTYVDVRITKLHFIIVGRNISLYID